MNMILKVVGSELKLGNLDCKECSFANQAQENGSREVTEILHLMLIHCTSPSLPILLDFDYFSWSAVFCMKPPRFLQILKKFLYFGIFLTKILNGGNAGPEHTIFICSTTCCISLAYSCGTDPPFLVTSVIECLSYLLMIAKTFLCS